MPDRVRLINYALIAPSIIYSVVVFPAWHRCRFGPSGYMAKALYGWAHLFCLWDICRGRRIGWQPTGGGNQKAGNRRIWLAVAAWNVPTCCAWVVLALVRMAQRGVADYAFMLLVGLFASVVTAMMLASRQNYVRTAVREITG
jgi:cellulose synthase (UDP-forming)